MKLVKVSELFEVCYGVNLELNKMQQIDDIDGINFVSRTAKNNGVSAVVKKLEGLEPIPAGMLSVAGGGSVLETFLQPKPFYSGRDLYYLSPLINMSDQEKLFYCMCIKVNKYRYNYGRQANRTLRDILIPDISEIPEEIKQVDLNKFHEASKVIIQDKIALNTNNWKDFSLTDLFSIFKGERLTKRNQVVGDTPLITAGDEKNGVTSRIDFETFKDSKKWFKNTITIDMFFNTFYQENIYFSDDNVHTLKIIEKYENVCNKYSYLFLVAILRNKKVKYSYGRQLRLNRLIQEKIKLPVDKNNDPDWDFMENYIKTIPYSSSI